MRTTHNVSIPFSTCFFVFNLEALFIHSQLKIKQFCLQVLNSLIQKTKNSKHSTASAVLCSDHKNDPHYQMGLKTQ